MRIRSLGVIDDAVVELSPGFTAVTGETGAGKTMVVTSLGLLLGGRADPALVRIGAKNAVVEGRIAVPEGAAAVVRAEEAGAELDDGALLISRTVSAEGRSRAHLGGRSVPVGVLAELADELVAVHGQTDQQGLLKQSRQRAALDRYAGDAVAVPLTKYGEAYRRLRAVAGELDEIVTRARERAQEADMLRYGLDEIAGVEPRAGEDVELAEEAERLGHAEALASAATAAHAALAGNPEDPEGVEAATLVAGAHRALEAVRSHDPALAALAERIGEIGILLGDVAGELAGYADDLDADPLRLAAVEERRAALTALTRKYGQDITSVLAWAAEGARRLTELDGDDERIEELTAERDALRAELGGLAQALTDARTEAAERFAAAVTAELASLAMPHARVSFEIRQSDDAEGVEVGGRTVAYGPSGVDEVELLLAPHPGAPPRPIAKGASGGELSRVMLAVEVVFAGTDPVPTYLFDEVDAGVGGKAAVEIGRRLARLARSAQVVVVTHLPQVAAFADRQLLVEKTNDGSVTRSGVKVLEGEERVRELSRMLAGLEDSQTARAHAEELLAAARADA
ncbi:DNA repair protein RecN [Streptomyces sp. LBUM 1478]|nr:DNA repair protein RecN [Streptomyces sp. LBUM 1484]MBP5866488.1 DNA repair protein RecN [Streptomyces sp. LBUM 1485]MBP5874765.1 DNA repair protein RecN [Streptomyces sp. LBUM 1477]MBP5882518.1 DNA repair protein RecN [Streptomyces sp. LBUM 1487]MBP5894610.1 DNA repair protein RecN [Streptomyces sp. LBUM 1481]MBP5898582.1 DNA repair protein RecN [Streptomyces sp. LBUM 1488]MBP5905182.1 DNA repair protein RecN [Streptomyces sp. LBUM 1478]MBP5917801.1 DNA repair protein RecN [Streptomyces 